MDHDDLRRRITGCWLGKAVGGTLGMPMEGTFAELDLTYYDPVPAAMLPNDDLDLQVLWAAVLDERRKAGGPVRVDRRDLGRAFFEHVDFPFDEYGVAKRNAALGLSPPATGAFDNWFANGMGAAIRSEIWACLAAGDPERAAAYAREDACIDHAGPGIEAEVFLAALEADCFTHDAADDPRPIVTRACGLLDAAGVTRRAIEDTLRWWDASPDWRAVRRRVLDAYGNDNVTDTTQNMAFTVLGWLDAHDHHGGDFGRAICTAVNCGYDTDCTGATAGAILGILGGPDVIGDDWLRPIGRDLVVSPEVRHPAGGRYPATLDELTEQVLAVRDALGDRLPEPPADDNARGPGVEVERAFVDWTSEPGWNVHCGLPPTPVGAPLLPGAERVTLPGTFATLARGEFERPTLLMQYAFEMPEDRRVLVMFNSPQAHRVWIDGAYAFGRESGRMAPSPHRPPLHQWTTEQLPAGRHTVTVALTHPDTGDAEWVIALADPVTRQWLPGLLR